MPQPETTVAPPMSEKQMKSAAKLVRNNCQPKTKITDELIDNMHKGTWDDDPTAKCYMNCVLVTFKLITKTGEVDMSVVEAQLPTLPEPRREPTLTSLNYCLDNVLHEDGDGKCDWAWRFARCIYTSNPDNCLARALFDNVAEAPDELAFCKGDVLVVLEQNTGNIEGWWLCSLRGRQGICPGNRLRLIPGVYEDITGSRGPSPQFPTDDIHSLQRQGKRRSWHVQPNKVLTPRKYNDVYLYDMPPSRCSPIPVHSLSPNLGSQGSDYYDVPPKAVPVIYTTDIRTCPRCSPAPSCTSPYSKDSQDSYDVPRPLLHSQNMLTPSSSASSLSITGDSFSSSNRSSLINMPDYDVPRSHPPHPSSKGPQLFLQQQHQQHYDVPQAHCHPMKELPLELSSALDTLQRLQSETTNTISRLLGFVTPNWRAVDKLEANVMDIKLAVIRLKTSLHDFSEFCEGALGNATRATDKNLAGKMVNLVLALKSSDKLINDATDNLNHHNWAVTALARTDDDDKNKTDDLEQIIACTRALTEDIRQAASFIQGNSTLLFKKDSVQSNNNHPEDYDYVNLDGKENKASSPKGNSKQYETLKGINEELDPQDKQLLTFFAIQTTTHHNNLTEAIDAFLLTIEQNKPPKTFLAHGKFVVLSAHKLVHIGDTVSRNVGKEDIKVRALNCANALSEALATSVTKTKQAALQFPSVTAVQDMVDSIVDISHLAKDLKCCLVQAAAQF